MRSYEFWGENWVTNRGKIGVKTGKKKGKFWENRNDNQVKTSPVILDILSSPVILDIPFSSVILDRREGISSLNTGLRNIDKNFLLLLPNPCQLPEIPSLMLEDDITFFQRHPEAKPKDPVMPRITSFPRNDWILHDAAIAPVQNDVISFPTSS